MQILSDIKEYAQSNNVPIVEDETIAFILNFITEKKIKTIFEIGTAIGYSALWMSTVDTVEKIVTLERNYGLAQIAQVNIKRAGKQKIIKVINQDALDFIIKDRFDLLIIDGAKAQYKKFFNYYIDFVDYVIVDNIDFHGMVKDPSLTKNRNTRTLVKKLAKFKEEMLENDDFNCHYLNKGDGIMLITKK